MLDRLPRALAIVRPDVRQWAADHAPHRNDGRNRIGPLLCDCPGVRPAGGAHDDARDVVLAQRPQHLRLAFRILVGVGEDRREAEAIERVLDAGCELGKKGIVEIADDHADEVGRGGAQAGRAAMIDVAQRPHGAAYALARLRRDQIAARQNQGNSRFRHARPARDIDDRHATGSLASFLPTRRPGHCLWPVFWNVPLERTNRLPPLICAAKRRKKRQCRAGWSCHLERDNLSLDDYFALVNDENQGRETIVSGELNQAILDALTDVEMPRRLPTRSADESLADRRDRYRRASLRGAGARQRRGGLARGGRAQTPRRRRHDRHAECVWRHVSLLRLR